MEVHSSLLFGRPRHDLVKAEPHHHKPMPASNRQAWVGGIERLFSCQGAPHWLGMGQPSQTLQILCSLISVSALWKDMESQIGLRALLSCLTLLLQPLISALYCLQRGSEFFCFFIGTDIGGMCGVRIARSNDPWGQPGSW